jgi:hypothetical protein
VVQGRNLKSIACLNLACRAQVLAGRSVAICSVPFLRRVLIDTEGSGPASFIPEHLHRCNVLAIPGFYDARFKPLSDAESYALSWWLIGRILNGCVPFVQTTDPLVQTWWTDALIELIHEKTTTFNFV